MVERLTMRCPRRRFDRTYVLTSDNGFRTGDTGCPRQSPHDEDVAFRCRPSPRAQGDRRRRLAVEVDLAPRSRRSPP
jgi:hypothetical protein